MYYIHLHAGHDVVYILHAVHDVGYILFISANQRLGRYLRNAGRMVWVFA
jgi:hypothetical protein